MKLKEKHWFLRIVVILTGLVIMVTVFTTFFLDALVKEAIIKRVYKSSHGFYSMEIENLNTHFWSGTVEMENVLLFQNPKKLDIERKDSLNENFSTIRLMIPYSKIRHIRWINYLISDDLKVGKLLIMSPDILVNGSIVSEKIRETNKTFIVLVPAIIAGFAGSLKIGELKITSGKLNYNINTETTTIAQSADNIFVEVKDILIDTIPSRKRMYSEDMDISLNNYDLQRSDGLYQLKVASISGNLSDSVLIFENLNFSKKKDTSITDKSLELMIKKISSEGINFSDLFYNKKITINHLLLESPQLSNNYDQIKNDGGSKEGKLPGIEDQYFVPSFVSDIVGSFIINNIHIKDGSFRNTTNINQDSIWQKADNIQLQIVEVAGDVIDTLRLKKPDHINISFNNYEFIQSHPATNFSIQNIKVSSFDSTIHLSDLNLYYMNYWPGHSKLYSNNHIDMINGSGFDFQALINRNKISLKKIVVDKPIIELRTHESKTSKVSSSSGSKDFMNLVDSFQVNSVDIRNGSFKYETTTNRDTILHQSKRYHLNLSGFTASKNQSLPDFQSISAQLFDYELKLVRVKCIIKSDRLNISSSKPCFIKNLRIDQYHDSLVHQNLFNTIVPDVVIDQFDIKRAMNKSEFSMASIRLNNLQMNIFMEQGKVLKPRYAMLMPNEIARAIPFYFKIDSVRINKGHFVIKEKQDASVVCNLNKTNALVYNITNDNKFQTKKNQAQLVAETQVQGQGKLALSMKVPLLSPEFNCSYQGKIGKMKIDTMNKILSYGMMKAVSGVIDSGSFEVNVIDGEATGCVKLVYHDLHVKALNSQGDETRLKSILANFVIKNSNPKHKNKEPEIVQIQGARKPEDGIFSFLWRPLKFGVIKTVSKDIFTRFNSQ